MRVYVCMYVCTCVRVYAPKVTWHDMIGLTRSIQLYVIPIAGITSVSLEIHRIVETNLIRLN